MKSWHGKEGQLSLYRPSCILAEAVSGLTDLLDGDSHGELSNSVLGTWGQGALVSLSSILLNCPQLTSSSPFITASVKLLASVNHSSLPHAGAEWVSRTWFLPSKTLCPVHSVLYLGPEYCRDVVPSGWKNDIQLLINYAWVVISDGLPTCYTDTDTCYNMDDPWMHHAKQTGSLTEGQTLCDCTSMMYSWWTYMKSSDL